MTPEERAVIRRQAVHDLRQAIEREGGDIVDGFVILLIAAMEVCASTAILEGKGVDQAREECISYVRTNFDKAFDTMCQAFREVAN